MNWYHHLPLQRKMLMLTLLICGAVLLMAIGAFFAFQILKFRSAFRHDSATLAVIIAGNSTGVMAFKDEAAAAEVVASLEANPTVIAASLLLPDGTVFAHYGAAETVTALAQMPPEGTDR